MKWVREKRSREGEHKWSGGERNSLKEQKKEKERERMRRNEWMVNKRKRRKKEGRKKIKRWTGLDHRRNKVEERKMWRSAKNMKNDGRIKKWAKNNGRSEGEEEREMEDWWTWRGIAYQLICENSRHVAYPYRCLVLLGYSGYQELRGSIYTVRSG